MCAFIAEPGFFPQLSEAQYHADPCPEPSFSSSIGKIIIEKSPLHARLAHPRLGIGRVDDSSDEMDFGELAHKLLLGKGAEIAEFIGDSWRGKEAAAFWDLAKAGGRIPALTKKILIAKAMVQEVRSQLDAMGLGYAFSPEDAEGASEVAAFWKEGATWCRALMDRLIIRKSAGRIEIFDFKTMSQSAHPKACAARIASMHYDLQRAHYVQGAQALLPDYAGRISFTFIFAETSGPFAVTPVRLTGEWATIGVSKWSRALSTWQACVLANKWPSFTDKILELEPPPWALASEMGAEDIRPK